MKRLFDYLGNLFMKSDSVAFDERRIKDARLLAEYHRQESVKARDLMEWAAVKEQHHQRMSAMYKDREWKL